MIRVIVEHLLKPGVETNQLIDVIHRLRAEAMKRPGYVTGEALIDSGDHSRVIVISTWNKEEQWNAWDVCEHRVEITRDMLPLLREPYKVSVLNFATFKAGRVLSIL